MSLIGRYLIDKFKAKVPRLTLPVPPYGDKNYWERVYKCLSVHDVYEWGDLTMKDLAFVKYKKIYQEEIQRLYFEDDHNITDGGTSKSSNTTSTMLEEDFSTIIRVGQKSNVSPSILILGCGNSNLGEEIYHYYNHPFSIDSNHMDDTKTTTTTTIATVENKKEEINHISNNHTKILQCDISPSVVHFMSQRCSHLPYMSFHVVDFCSRHAIQSNNSHGVNNDGRKDPGQISNEKHLSPSSSLTTSIAMSHSIPCSSVGAVIDKGLVDALFCSNKSEIPKVMMNVHQCLRDSSVFIFFSFSRPEYLLKETLVMDNLWDEEGKKNHDRMVGGQNASGRLLKGLWSEIDVCQLENIFMYKFVKRVDSGQDCYDYYHNNGRNIKKRSIIRSSSRGQNHTTRTSTIRTRGYPAKAAEISGGKKKS
jgi:hypothetical protein